MNEPYFTIRPGRYVSNTNKPIFVIRGNPDRTGELHDVVRWNYVGSYDSISAQPWNFIRQMIVERGYKRSF